MAFDWKQFLGSVAPTAATLLGSPLAGIAIKAVSTALGVPEDKESIQKTILSGNLTGEQIVALKQAELDLQKHLEDNNINLEQIAANDRDSARKREISVKDNTPKILAYVVTVGFFGTLAALMFGNIPDRAHDVMLVLIGSLGTAWTGIITYYFGSSAGSAKKTDLLHSFNSTPSGN